MNFFLAKDQKVVFNKGTFSKENELFCRKTSFQTTWQSGETADETWKSNPQISEEIHNKFGGFLQGKTLEVEIGIDYKNSALFKVKKVRVSGDNCFQKINSTAHSEGFIVNAVIVIKNLRSPNYGDYYNTRRATTDYIRISGLNEETISGIEWDEMLYSNIGYSTYWNNSSFDFEGELEIMLTFSRMECECPSSIELKELNHAYRNMLSAEVGADISIVPVSGTSIKCHRAILLAHCPKLTTKIKGTFGDPDSNKCDIPELTEDGVGALMNCMYLNESASACQTCGLALELYSVSKKYDIKMLSDKIRNMFISKPDSWYDADMLVKFYEFTKNRDEDVNLKRRVVKLIKANKETIKKSDSFIQFIKNDPTGMVELFGLILE